MTFSLRIPSSVVSIVGLFFWRLPVVRPFIFYKAEVLSDVSSGSAPPSPSVPTASGVEKLSVPGKSASATASAGACRAAEEGSQKENTPGSQGKGVEKSASREKSDKERERAVNSAKEAVRETAAQLAAEREGPSVRADAEKSTEATPPKKPKLTFVMGQERSARVPAVVTNQTGGPITSDTTSSQFLGGSSTESALVSGASLARMDDIEIVEDLGDGNENLLAPVPGPAPPCDQTGRSASRFQQSRRSPAGGGRIDLRSVPPPLAAARRVSLPSSIDPTGTGAFPRVALPGMATGAPSPGSVALTAVLEVRRPAAPGTVYPVPEGFVDHEIWTEIGQPIMDVPVLHASKLALRWPFCPRRSVSVVDLEKLSGDGPIRDHMLRLMKVRSRNPGRADAGVGIMTPHGRYAIPAALECARTFSHEPRDALYLEFASAMFFGWPGAPGRVRGRDLPDGDAAQLVAVSHPRASNDVG